MNWQPIEMAPRNREIWVCGLAKVWVESCPFAWQGHALWDEYTGGWITESFDDGGEHLYVEATHWVESMRIPFPSVSPYL